MADLLRVPVHFGDPHIFRPRAVESEAALRSHVCVVVLVIVKDTHPPTKKSVFLKPLHQCNGFNRTRGIGISPAAVQPLR